VPVIWSVRIDSEHAPACLAAAVPVKLESLVRSNVNREERLACMALLLMRDGRAHSLPDETMELLAGDEILFAGTREARQLQALTLANVNVLDYVTTGRDAAGGWIWQALRARA
jgi:hypothetical protein